MKTNTILDFISTEDLRVLIAKASEEITNNALTIESLADLTRDELEVLIDKLHALVVEIQKMENE